MKNFVQPGSTLSLPAPYDVVSGAGFQVGALFAIAFGRAAAGTQVEGVTAGVFTLPKTGAQAWAVGARIYWDDANKRCDSDSAKGRLIGVATVEAGNPSSTGTVRLNGCALGGGGTVATVPGQPAKPVLTAMAGAVSVAWTAGAAGSTATTGNVWTDINGNVTQLTTNPQVITAPGGTPYTGTVTTVNAQGAGPASVQADPVTPTGASGNNVDVLVYDATMAGVFSALSAKAEGVSVMLVAPRSHIGGIPTSGVQFTDMFSTCKYMAASAPESSFYRKLMVAQASAMGLNLNRWYNDQSAAAESKLTRSIIMQWLSDAGITVVTNSPMTSVTVQGDPNSGGTTTDVTLLGIGKVTAKQFIDGSYQGVLGLLANITTAKYMGAEPTSMYSEATWAGGYTTAGAQPTNYIDPYVIPGDASSGLIKYVQGGALQTPGSELAGRVQFPGFRINITNVAGKKKDFPEPDSYDPLDYEVYRRDIVANKSTFTALSQFIQIQTAIPSLTAGMTNKRDGNQKGIFGIDYPDADANAAYYSLRTEPERIAFENKIKQWFLGLWKFWRTHPDVPAAARADFANWGMCNDDYLDTDGFPPILYPREGWRYKAANTLTGYTVFGALNASASPVALSIGYAADSHPMLYGVSTTNSPHVIQVGPQSESAVHSTVGARIPMAVLDMSLANVQTPWGPNCSRIVYNVIRLEPIVCGYSQAAGIRAALAVKNNTTLAAVPYADIAVRQNLYGLDPVGGNVVTVDGTTRTKGSFTFEGTWTDSGANNLCGTAGFKSCTTTTGVNRFTAAVDPIGAGNWKLQLKYIDHNGSTGTQDRGKLSVVVKGNGAIQAAQVIDQLSNRAGVLTNGDWQTVYTGPWIAGDNVVGTYDNSGITANIVAARIVPA